MKTVFLLVAMVLTYANYVLADVIYLKDGTKVEGKILSKDAVGVTVQVGTRPKKYFSAQIDRIEQDKADETVSRTYENLSLDEIALITRLMDATGVSEVINMSVSRVINSAPIVKQEEYKVIFNEDAIKRKIIEIYAGYFTKEELEVLVQFHESDAGQKLRKTAPRMTEDIMKTIASHLKDAAAQVQQ